MAWSVRLLIAISGLSGATSLVPGIYLISGNVSPWWFGGHLLILSDEVNSSAGSVLFAYDHDSDCIIPGCEWRSIYRADVTRSTWEFSRALSRSLSPWLLLPLAAYHLGVAKRCWQVILMAMVVLVAAGGNVASEAGSYEALITVVKRNPDIDIPHIGEARAEIEVCEDGRVRGRLRTWFTTHFLNELLGGIVEESSTFDNQVPAFYKDMGHLYQDATGNNFSLPSEPLLGYAVPGNLEHLYPPLGSGCHPEEENGPKIAYSVGSYSMVPVICLRYASGGLVLKALEDPSGTVSSLHTWRASSDCATGAGNDSAEFPYAEFRLSTGSCDPWRGSNRPCPDVVPVECLAAQLAPRLAYLVILLHMLIC